MTSPLRKALVATVIVAVSSVTLGCGQSAIVAAHSSITAGCVSAAVYAGGHDTVTDNALSAFQNTCHVQLDELERWHYLESPDGGAND